MLAYFHIHTSKWVKPIIRDIMLTFILDQLINPIAIKEI